MSNILLLPRFQVAASVAIGEDFAPPPFVFFQSDGETPVDLNGISFTATIGALPPLTAANGGITVAGNMLAVFLPAAALALAPGVYPFALAASDGTFTRQLFASSSALVVGPDFSFAAAQIAGETVAGLAPVSASALIALIASLVPPQSDALVAALDDARAAYVPALDFSHTANSQLLPLLALH